MQIERTNKDFQVFINNNDEWQSLDKVNEDKAEWLWEYPCDYSYEFPIQNINEDLLPKIDLKQEYDFMTDEGIKFHGKITQNWLWIKWYNKKKGKKYKKYCKHSREVIFEFKGKVVE